MLSINITINPLLMENHTNNLVSDDVVNYKSKTLHDLHEKQHNHSANKDIKLSFNKISSANHYLIISNCLDKNHLGKSFKIIKSTNNSSFFKKLYRLISKEEDIPLIRHTSINGNIFWTTVRFNIINEEQINFSIAKNVFSYKHELIMNKLTNILVDLELRLGTDISQKYLRGFLEERGIETFNDYINQTFVNN